MNPTSFGKGLNIDLGGREPDFIHKKIERVWSGSQLGDLVKNSPLFKYDIFNLGGRRRAKIHLFKIYLILFIMVDSRSCSMCGFPFYLGRMGIYNRIARLSTNCPSKKCKCIRFHLSASLNS